jgi:dephospho-CoA kinase
MVFVGLTGGVGAGKSTVADLFRQRGWPVVDSDVIAREVVEPGQPALAEIVKRFGPEMIGPDGRLRRDLMARCVFADPARRRQLEAILHPRIREVWLARAAAWREEGSTRGLAVVPLLYEVGLAHEFDRVVCVACTAKSQRERLLGRGWSEEQVRQRLEAQWPMEKKMALADAVIWAEGGLDVLAAQVDRLLALWGL